MIWNLAHLTPICNTVPHIQSHLCKATQRPRTRSATEVKWATPTNEILSRIRNISTAIKLSSHASSLCVSEIYSVWQDLVRGRRSLEAQRQILFVPSLPHRCHWPHYYDHWILAARLCQHTSKNPCDYPDIAQMRIMLDTTEDPAENITILQSRAFSGNDTLLVKALQQAPILQHHFSHRPALICAWIRGNPAV